MKHLIIAILLISSVSAIGQGINRAGSTKRNTTVIENDLYVKNKTAIDSSLRAPSDTLASAPNGSIVVKGNKFYFKSFVSGYWVEAGSSGGTPTFQQTLTTGSTMTQANNVAQAGYKFRFTGGLVTTDSILSGNPVGTHAGIAKNELQGTTYIESLVSSTVTSSLTFNTNYSANGSIKLTTGASDLTKSGIFWTGASPNGTQYIGIGQNHTNHFGIGDNSFAGWSLLADTRGGVPSWRFFTKTPGSSTSIVSWGVESSGEFMIGSHTLSGSAKLQVTGGVRLAGINTAASPNYFVTKQSDSLLSEITPANALTLMAGAPLASPTFTGTPLAPTASLGTNTTQISTTAFVKNALDNVISYGTWAPSLTNTTNVAGTSATAKYTRIGDVVTFSIQVTIDPTATGLVELGISIPVASEFTADTDATGTCTSAGSTDKVAIIKADGTNNRLLFTYTCSDITAQIFYITGQYTILTP
jgi:hypothetical protein